MQVEAHMHHKVIYVNTASFKTTDFAICSIWFLTNSIISQKMSNKETKAFMYLRIARLLKY